jgi:hypothetical protein
MQGWPVFLSGFLPFFGHFWPFWAAQNFFVDEIGSLSSKDVNSLL